MTDKTHFSFGILIRPLDWRFGANRTNRVMGIQIGPIVMGIGWPKLAEPQPPHETDHGGSETVD